MLRIYRKGIYRLSFRKDRELLYSRFGFIVEQTSSEKNHTIITHNGFSKDSIVQQYIQYAYDLGGLDLVTLIECENGTRNMYKQSEVVKNGRREPSYGFCQINRDYYPHIIDNKLFRDDRKRQLDRCKELMDNGTPFYGRNRKIKGVKCSEYVKDRFTLVDQI